MCQREGERERERERLYLQVLEQGPGDPLGQIITMDVRIHQHTTRAEKILNINKDK